MLIPIAIVVVGLFLVASPGLENESCACEPPPDDKEIQRLIKIAEKGDTSDSIRATGRVALAYVERSDERNAQIWREKAMAAGDPHTLYRLAEKIGRKAKGETDLNRKIEMLREQLSLLKQAFPNRRMFDPIGRSVYASSLRSTQATLTVLADGEEVWLKRAEAGDPVAAYHMARFYFYGELDQDKRSRREEIAGKAGDPELAHDLACCWRKTRNDLLEGDAIIENARARKDLLASVSDPWVRSVFMSDLDAAHFQIRRRLKELKAHETEL